MFEKCAKPATLRAMILGLAILSLGFTASPAQADAKDKALAAWDGLQLRIRVDRRWHDYRFGTLEVHKQGLVHRGKVDTAFAWEHIVECKLHPLDNRVDMRLKNPERSLQLLTMLNWIRFDFERMFRDLERFRKELTPVPEKKESHKSAENCDAR